MHFQRNTMVIGNDGYKDEKQPQYCKENKGVAKNKKNADKPKKLPIYCKNNLCIKNTTGMNALA